MRYTTDGQHSCLRLINYQFQGIVIIFKVALSLLKLSRKELLAMDFEGALNYFRITLPKLYRNVDACKELINTALNIKVREIYWI